MLEKLADFAPGARVIVVDSSPPDETPRVTAELLKVPNHSFAHMLNCGLKLVKTPYAAHMNADVFLVGYSDAAFGGGATTGRRHGRANGKDAGRSAAKPGASLSAALRTTKPQRPGFYPGTVAFRVFTAGTHRSGHGCRRDGRVAAFLQRRHGVVFSVSACGLGVSAGQNRSFAPRRRVYA